MSSRLFVAFVVLILAGSTVAVFPRLSDPGVKDPAGGHHEVVDAVVASFDGTEIAITVFRPAAASADAPVPLLLHSHGWAGSRAKVIEEGGFIEMLLDNGYGALSIDMRGHGDSGDVARVHNVDYEIRDVSVVIDWAATNLDWVAHQDAAETGHANDLLLGSIGGSYGGGYQLLAAALDGRLDALAPEITWNDLPRSLAPNEAIKSDWVQLLYWGGKATARLAPEIDEAYQSAMLTNEIAGSIAAQLARSSPKSYPGAIDVPTLLIQGVPDTLFNLNEAVDNYEQILATGTDVRLFTHLGGHLLSLCWLGGFIDQECPVEPPFPQPADQGSPCGDVDEVRLAWFDEQLKGIAGAADDIAQVSLALDDGGCVKASAWPLVEAPELAAVGAPVILSQAPLGGSVLLPIRSAENGLTLAGIPRLTGTITSGIDATFYVSLAAAGPGGVRVLDSQVTGYRVQGMLVNAPIDIEMGGIGAVLAPGEELVLKVDAWNEQFATNAGRVPGAIVLADLSVDLPVLS